jgi:hypothetical protein
MSFNAVPMWAYIKQPLMFCLRNLFQWFVGLKAQVVHISKELWLKIALQSLAPYLHCLAVRSDLGCVAFLRWEVIAGHWVAKCSKGTIPVINSVVPGQRWCLHLKLVCKFRTVAFSASRWFMVWLKSKVKYNRYTLFHSAGSAVYGRNRHLWFKLV